jgi:hypothetical protein
MRKIFMLSALAMMLIISSCKKEETDLCKGITCLNNGTCVNGSCNCEEGYSGATCQNEIKPQSVRLVSVEVSRFPMANSNSLAWDVSSCCPDIFITVDRAIGGNVYSHPTYYNNAETGNTYIFNMAAPVNLNPDTEYYINLYDEDGASDEFMGGYTFFPYSSGGGFPAQRGFVFGPITIILTYEYIF